VDINEAIHAVIEWTRGEVVKTGARIRMQLGRGFAAYS
jgi:hypothetical protein